MQVEYSEFLAAKRHVFGSGGIHVPPESLPPALFPFQRELVQWALESSRAALFCDTGLGKTIQYLSWAQQVVERTNGNVLILTPLAVAHQTVAEADRFGIEAHRSYDGRVFPGITVANYDRLHLFNAADFAGVAMDESAAIKDFDGARRQQITEFMRRMSYRLLCSATPAPNDYTELGTSSEALGYLGHMDMLNRFFKNDRNNSASGRMYGQAAQWRFKGHAEEPFWQWVCSWARAIRRPSDMGYDDNGFILPPLTETEHVVEGRTTPQGMLFAVDAVTLHEQRQERRRTLNERCERVAELTSHDQPALVWCHLNDEGDLLERLIPGAVQVAGSETDEAKEEKLMAFANGEARVLVTKPRIAGWGLNFQHCAHVATFASHSFEQYYQSVRRCWRFGQKRPVQVDMVVSTGERRVLDNLQAKAKSSEHMLDNLVAMMHSSMDVRRSDTFGKTGEVPTWLA